MTYRGRCHCGAVRFRFESEPITAGVRCNCSMCVRRGSVMSSYIAATDFVLESDATLATYQFGDRDMRHVFCATCGVSTFSEVVGLPPGYEGRARLGARRVNLGCIDALDVCALEIDTIDGRSL